MPTLKRGEFQSEAEFERISEDFDHLAAILEDYDGAEPLTGHYDQQTITIEPADDTSKINAIRFRKGPLPAIPSYCSASGLAIYLAQTPYRIITDKMPPASSGKGEHSRLERWVRPAERSLSDWKEDLEQFNDSIRSVGGAGLVHMVHGESPTADRSYQIAPVRYPFDFLIFHPEFSKDDPMENVPLQLLSWSPAQLELPMQRSIHLTLYLQPQPDLD